MKTSFPQWPRQDKQQGRNWRAQILRECCSIFNTLGGPRSSKVNTSCFDNRNSGKVSHIRVVKGGEKQHKFRPQCPADFWIMMARGRCQEAFQSKDKDGRHLLKCQSFSAIVTILENFEFPPTLTPHPGQHVSSSLPGFWSDTAPHGVFIGDNFSDSFQKMPP